MSVAHECPSVKKYERQETEERCDHDICKKVVHELVHAFQAMEVYILCVVRVQELSKVAESFSWHRLRVRIWVRYSGHDDMSSRNVVRRGRKAGVVV